MRAGRWARPFPPRGGNRIIDAHSHVHDPADLHVRLLNEAGADRAVLFASRPHPERATDLASLRREVAALDDALGGQATTTDRFSHALAELDAVLAAHPGRFIAFGSVPLGGPEEAVRRAVDHQITGLGRHGIGELTPPPGGADLVEPVLRAAQDLGGVPIVVHGAAPTTAGDIAALGELARRYPRVPLVLSQLGGPNWLTAIELVRDTPSMRLELSTASIVFAVRFAIAEIPERVLFGSDAPYGDPVLARATIERVTAPGEVRDRVLGGNLAEMIDIT